MTFRIEAPHFVAGGSTRDDCIDGILDQFVCQPIAPIISYMEGWEYHRVINYCRKKNWNLYEL